MSFCQNRLIKQLNYHLVSSARSQNVYNHRFEHSRLAFISQEQATKLNNVELQPNDILLNITGDSVARATIVSASILPARINQHVMIIRPDINKLDPHYLLGFLTSEQRQNMLLTLASVGATRNALTKQMVENIEIPENNYDKQKKIGTIVQSFNSQIATLNNINDNLVT